MKDRTGVNGLRALEVPHGWTEVWVIQHIEHLCPELQLEKLMDGEVTMDGKVPLGGAEPLEGIPPKVTLPRRVAIRVGRR